MRDRYKIALFEDFLEEGLKAKIRETLIEAIHMQELGEDEKLDISLFNIEISAYYTCKEDSDIGGEG